MHNADIKAFALSKIGQDAYDLIACIIMKSSIFDRLQQAKAINKEVLAMIDHDEGYYDIEDFLKVNDNHLYIGKKTITRLINYMRWCNFMEEFQGGPGLTDKDTCWTNIFAYFDIVYHTIPAIPAMPVWYPPDA